MYSIVTPSTLTNQSARPLSAGSMRLWITTHATLLNIVTFAVLLLVSFAYIIQVNSTASKGYQIRDLENSIHQLSVANQQTQLEIREAQSLKNINRAVKMIGMVPVDQAVYVEKNAGSVAFAK